MRCRFGDGILVSSRLVPLLLQSEGIIEYPGEINPLFQWIVQIADFAP